MKLFCGATKNGETIVEYQVAEPFFKCLSWDASGQILAVANQSLDVRDRLESGCFFLVLLKLSKFQVTFVEFECYDD